MGFYSDFHIHYTVTCDINLSISKCAVYGLAEEAMQCRFIMGIKNCTVLYIHNRYSYVTICKSVLTLLFFKTQLRMYISMHKERFCSSIKFHNQQNKLDTVVWEIFIRDNLVVKFIHCVIFLWVSCTHKKYLTLEICLH